MALQLVAMTDREIQGHSFGRVNDPSLEPNPDWEASKGSLFDRSAFGPDHDWCCACGKYRGEDCGFMICDICGVKLGVADELRRQRFGHIQLACDIAHPLLPTARVSVIPVLPIAFRAGSTRDEDLNVLYAGVLHANLSVEEAADSTRAEAVAKLAEAVTALYCNERLDDPVNNGVWRIRSIGELLADSCDGAPDNVGVYLRGLGLRVDTV